MIENLVAMARIERGGDFGGARPVLLDRIIKQLVERERALWPEVTISLASNGPVQMVAADEEYLAQIMRNLLSNAAKYSGPGSTVEVSLEDGDGEVLVRVRDNGPGIEADDADRLFGLYYRAAPASKTAPGAGIGLFVCRELVATMGGRIWAQPREGGGAEFGFSIPAYVDELDIPAPGDEASHVFDRAQEELTPSLATMASVTQATTEVKVEPMDGAEPGNGQPSQPGQPSPSKRTPATA
jgi:two-component system sensor histidine kinase KdpD